LPHLLEALLGETSDPPARREEPGDKPDKTRE
jgi:hypothetical protein